MVNVGLNRYNYEVNIQELTESFGWDTANENTLFWKQIKQNTMAKLSNPVLFTHAWYWK